MFKDQIISLENRLAVLEDRLANSLALREKLELALKERKARAQLYKDCADCLKGLDSSLRTSIKTKIETIVTRLYQHVFQNTDMFVIEFTERRGVSNVEFYIETVKGGKRILLDPCDDVGGGVVDIIALGLRIAALMLYTPALDRVLILDEPLKFVSNETSGSLYKKRAAECLQQFSKEYGIQLLIVTHDTEFIQNADKKFTVSLDDKGYSKVEELI